MSTLKKEYKIAIATSQLRIVYEKIIGSTSIASLIDASCCGDEALPKPDPQMIHILLDRLGVQPERAVMVGDTPFDLQLAKNAGVQAIAISSGHYKSEELANYPVVAIIEQLDKLTTFLF